MHLHRINRQMYPVLTSATDSAYSERSLYRNRMTLETVSTGNYGITCSRLVIE